MNGWPKVEVSAVCSHIVDCVNRTAPTVDNITPYRMIRTTNVRNGRIDLSGCRYVSKETFERWTRRLDICDGDVILTREAPIGEVGYIKDLGSVFLGQRIMHYRADAEKMDGRFLFYAFQSPALKAQFGAHDGSGSVVSHIRVADCHRFLVPLPPQNEQLAISSLLGALDDKIELNRRMNETLEQMAQAIFKDWFVDFGPVRRKQEGATDPVAIMGGVVRSSVRATELSALFPNVFGAEGLPQDWTNRPIREIFDINPKEPMKKGAVAPYSDMASLPTKGPTADAPMIREFGSGMRFRNGDALLARITPCLENGKAAFVDFLSEGEVGWGSTEFIVFRAKPPIPKPVAYLLIRQEDFRSHAIRSMTGTSGRQRAQETAIGNYSFAFANKRIYQALDEIFTPLFLKIRANALENRTLAETRDYLLPKLMSGEVRVRDAERHVEDIRT